MRTRIGHARAIIGIAASLALALALAGCGPAPDARGPGEFRRGDTFAPVTLDPVRATLGVELDIASDMFVGLFMADAAGEPVPGMAESWTVSEDGLAWTFTLREAVWSDGVPVTAHDFVFAKRRAGHEPVGEFGVRTDLGIQWEALDERTVRITLDAPEAYLPELLMQVMNQPAPRHAIEAHGDLWLQPQNIVVNGPFTLAEWSLDDRVRLARNPRYWAADSVCLDSIDYVYTADGDDAERAVRAGRLDAFAGLPADRIVALQRDFPDYVRLHPAFATVFISFNTLQAPLNDVSVRTALGMVFDANRLGAGSVRAVSLSPQPESVPGQWAQLRWADQPIEARRAEAQAMLRAAGFGPDNPLTVTLTHTDSEGSVSMGRMIAEDWSLIAPWVRAEASQVDSALYSAILKDGGFEAFLNGWVGQYADPMAFLSSATSETANYTGWSDPDYERLVETARASTDRAERDRLMLQAEQILLDAAAYAPLFHPANRAMVNPEVEGWVGNLIDVHPAQYLCVAGRQSAQAG